MHCYYYTDRGNVIDGVDHLALFENKVAKMRLINGPTLLVLSAMAKCINPARKVEGEKNRRLQVC